MPLDESRPFVALQVALLKIDRRLRPDDAAGDLLLARLESAGHRLAARTQLTGNRAELDAQLRRWITDPQVDCVIVAGGTGLDARDVVPEVLAGVWDREIPGFGELFRQYSVRNVGSSAIASRACAGVADATCLFAVPSSPGGAADAWDAVLATQLDSRYRPCNLVSLMRPAHELAHTSAGGE